MRATEPGEVRAFASDWRGQVPMSLRTRRLFRLDHVIHFEPASPDPDGRGKGPSHLIRPGLTRRRARFRGRPRVASKLDADATLGRTPRPLGSNAWSGGRQALGQVRRTGDFSRLDRRAVPAERVDDRMAAIAWHCSNPVPPVPGSHAVLPHGLRNRGRAEITTTRDWTRPFPGAAPAGAVPGDAYAGWSAEPVSR